MVLLPVGALLTGERIGIPAPAQRKTAALLLASSGCYVAAFMFPFTVVAFDPPMLDALPAFVRTPVRDWMVSTAGLPVGEHYLARMVYDLLVAKELLVGGALFLFSCVAPGVKLGVTSSLVFGSPSEIQRASRLQWLHVVERWSMADVFVVALLVAYLKADALHFAFSAGPGLYFYTASAVLGALAVGRVQPAGQSAQP